MKRRLTDDPLLRNTRKVYLSGESGKLAESHLSFGSAQERPSSSLYSDLLVIQVLRRCKGRFKAEIAESFVNVFTVCKSLVLANAEIALVSSHNMFTEAILSCPAAKSHHERLHMELQADAAGGRGMNCHS